jgi:TrmH family RNA methyltransferase
MTITSRANPAVKQWKALAARTLREEDTARIWIEGEHLVQEAQAAGLQIVEVIACEDIAVPSADQVHRVTRNVMAAISQLGSPPAMAAVIALREPARVPITQDCLVLDGVQDPGNVGTILRCAWAFGVKHIIMTLGCASPWSTKALRAGQGAQFHLAIHERISADALPRLLHVPLFATGLDRADSITKLNFCQPCALAFGHEGQGVSEAIRSVATAIVRIDMPGGAESLNVAAACAICLYEQSRQRAALA